MFLERYGRVLRIRRGRGCCEEWRDLTSTSATIRFDANEPSISPRKFSSCKSTPEIHIQIYICTYSLYLLFYFHTSHVKTHESNDAKVPFRNASVIRQGKFRERDGGEKNIRTASDGFKVTEGSVDIFRERGGEYIYIYVYISIRLEGGRSRRDNLAMFLFLYETTTIPLSIHHRTYVLACSFRPSRYFPTRYVLLRIRISECTHRSGFPTLSFLLILEVVDAPAFINPSKNPSKFLSTSLPREAIISTTTSFPRTRRISFLITRPLWPVSRHLATRAIARSRNAAEREIERNNFHSRFTAWGLKNKGGEGTDPRCTRTTSPRRRSSSRV